MDIKDEEKTSTDALTKTSDLEAGGPLKQQLLTKIPQEEAVTPTKSEYHKRSQLESEESEVELPTSDSNHQDITKTAQLEAVEREKASTGDGALAAYQAIVKTPVPSELPINQAPVVGYDYTLVNAEITNDQDFKCPICMLLPREPAKVSCCGAIFCNACINNHHSNQNACPLCKEEFKWIIDKSLQRKISGLEVHCVNQAEGCQWTGQLRHVEKHLQTCQVTSCKKCEKRMLRSELSEHMDSDCDHRIIPCEYSFAGCNFKGPKIKMPSHIQDNTSEHLKSIAKLVKQEKKCRFSLWVSLALIAASLALIANISVTVIFFISRSEITGKVVTNKERLCDIEWQISDLNITLRANGLAIKSLTYDVRKDLHPTLHDQKTTVDQLKLDIERLTHDVHKDLHSMLLDQEAKLETLTETVDQLKLDVNELQSGITHYIDDIFQDAINKAKNWFWPTAIEKKDVQAYS